MIHQALVSIGLPTYNRPSGLRTALDHIRRQTHQNLEIIVSDNCSPDPEVARILKEVELLDSRIRCFRQDTNIGAAANFHFVLEHATGGFFMWAADDDYFESHDLVENLLKHCENNILAFPDFNIFTKPDKLETKVIGRIYANCRTPWHYLNAWSRNLSGYPVYGMFNLKMLDQEKIRMRSGRQLAYYSEGTLLHRIFLSEKVRFVPNVFIRIDNNSTRPDPVTLLRHFAHFSSDSFALILRARTKRKLRILRNVFICCRAHFGELYKGARKHAGLWQSAWIVWSSPPLAAYKISQVCSKLSSRIRRAVRKVIKLGKADAESHDPIEHERQNHLWLVDLRIKTVIDVGANAGQFSRRILNLIPEANIFCFEPIKSCFEELERNVYLNENVKLFNFALGNAAGKQTIHLNEFSPSSSILEMEDLHRKAFAHTAQSTTEIIEIRRLDDMKSELHFERPVLLKIDVQGYECEVIRGGLETMKNIDVVVVETSFECLYRNQPLFHDVYEMLRAQGFVYKGNYEQLINPANGQILQADSLFFRAGFPNLT